MTHIKNLRRKDQAEEYLSKLETHKAMDLHGIHPQVLQEFTDVTVKTFLIIIK